MTWTSLAAAACLCAVATGAQAVTSCTASGAVLSLGPYTGETSAPADSVGSFTVRCTRDGGPQDVPVTLGIGPSGTSGTIASRKLKQVSGSDLLSYNLYRDALRQSVWGETPGVDTMTRTVSIPNKATADVTFNIYGRIPGLQNVYAGAYSDVLVVTFSY